MKNSEEAEERARKWRDAVRQLQADKAEQARATKPANPRRQARSLEDSKFRDPLSAPQESKPKRQARKRHRAPPVSHKPKPASVSDSESTEEDQEFRCYDLTRSTVSSSSDRQHVPKKTQERKSDEFTAKRLAEATRKSKESVKTNRNNIQLPTPKRACGAFNFTGCDRKG